MKFPGEKTNLLHQFLMFSFWKYMSILLVIWSLFVEYKGQTGIDHELLYSEEVCTFGCTYLRMYTKLKNIHLFGEKQLSWVYLSLFELDHMQSSTW